MKSTNITVKYINPPKGNGPASVKDTNGVYWKVWTTGKRPLDLDQFSEGGTYTVGYTTEQYNGKDQHTIQEVQNVTGEQVMAAPKHPAPSIAPKANGDHNRDEQIFVCGIVNNAVAAGKIDPISAAEILDVTKAASAAFHAWRKE